MIVNLIEKTFVGQSLIYVLYIGVKGVRYYIYIIIGGKGGVFLGIKKEKQKGV